MLRRPVLPRTAMIGVAALAILVGSVASPAAGAEVAVFTPAGSGVTISATLESTEITATFSVVAADTETTFYSFPATDYPEAAVNGPTGDFVFVVGGGAGVGVTLETCFSYDPADGVASVYAQRSSEGVWDDKTTSNPSSDVACGTIDGDGYSGDFILVHGAVAPEEPDPPIVPGPLPIITEDYEVRADPYVGPNDFNQAAGAPSVHLEIRNLSVDEQVRIGLSLDLAVQGAPDRMWLPESYGVIFGEEEDLDSLTAFFSRTLEPGEVFELDVPSWSGKTYGFYLLSSEPLDAGQLLGSYTAPGGFVSIRLGVSDELPVGIGSEALVSGAGVTPEVFPGVTATVTAANLIPGEVLDLWLAPNLDYFWFYLIGGVLPVNAVNVGLGTVAGDGTLSTTFDVPLSTPLGSYQLVAGDNDTRYWPAGSYSSFDVTVPAASQTEATPSGSNVPVTVPIGVTTVDFTFPTVGTAGETTVSASTTGPASDSFLFTSNPSLYYHIDTTALFTGQVTVCITYDPTSLNGGIPYLYHYKQVGPSSYQWENITTSRVDGLVCGLTDSFSPFTLGYPTAPPDVVLTSKDQCKKGGWATSTSPVFKNQGQCVSYFARSAR